MKRWKAVATYKSDAGPVDIEYEIEELEEIQTLIERGPDWNALIDIRITLANRLYDCTVEEQSDPDFNPL
jgi:hypothetical protein